MKRAFTIIELLVVVSIIALLVGILLPAIGKAREQAQLTKSEANLRNIGTAYEIYAAQWNDRQPTSILDNIASYGDTPQEALGWYESNICGGPVFDCIPGVHWGFGYYPIWDGQWCPAVPICMHQDFWGNGWGAWRLPNLDCVNAFIAGDDRVNHELWFAPKDEIVMAAVEPCLADPDGNPFCSDFAWSSYCRSPAGMFSPDVLSENDEGLFWTDPWTLDGGMRCPSMSMALYPELKTMLIEHNWLQQTRSECNPNFSGGTYEGCEPYYFNAAFESTPVAVFYDGHIELIGTREATRSDARVMQQSGHGLWSRDTDWGEDGYFSDVAYDWTTTSFHVLTIDGIRGRDVTGG